MTANGTPQVQPHWGGPNLLAQIVYQHPFFARSPPKSRDFLQSHEGDRFRTCLDYQTARKQYHDTVALMPQSFDKISLHIVFSTKQRIPWLQCEQLRSELYSYMATILRNMECPAIILNGIEEHVHGLCLLSRKVCVMDLIKDAKTETSKWIKRQSHKTRQFA